MSPFSKETLPFEETSRNGFVGLEEDDPRIPQKIGGFENIEASDIDHQRKIAVFWYHDGVRAKWQLIKTPDGKERALILARMSNGTSTGTFISSRDISDTIKIVCALFTDKKTKNQGTTAKESDLPFS
ncbi:MAG: hypothetical protein WC246_00125 [Candidatus Paceibacterota bacterium]|jgi:hypothetical protein